MKNTIYILLLFVVSFLYSCSSSEPDTCEICGYKAIKGDKCQYCGFGVWNEDMNIKKEDYLKKSQKDWFFVPGMEVNFYEPKEVSDFLENNTYKKDSLWKPVITEADIAQ